MPPRRPLYVGAHVPQRATLVQTMEAVRAAGGNVLQLFVANPRSGKITEASRVRYFAEAEAVRAYAREHDLRLVVHSAYPLNTARDAPARGGFGEAYWVTTVLQELAIAEALGAFGVIVHTGRWAASGPPASEARGRANMREALLEVLRRAPSGRGAPKLILETPSGAGTELLGDVAAFAAFWRELRAAAPRGAKRRLAMCLDTAHVHAAGAAPSEALRALIAAAPHGAVALVHLNNTPVARGGRADRHLGLLDPKGSVARDELRAVARIARATGAAVVMETPDDAYVAEIPWVRAAAAERA